MRFDEEFFNLGYIDRLSYKETFIHNIDARVKLVIVILYIISVISYSKYTVSSLFPFLLIPVLFMTLGEIPVKFVLKRLVVVSPFIFFIAIFNPLLERNIAFYIYGIPINYGTISFISIIIKFVLTVSIIIILVATTSFAGLCYALRYFKIPEIFVNQLLFLYRYIFVLTEEAMRMIRARDMRSFGKKGTELNFYTKLAGSLLVRSINRAERIYYAMLSRGFNGTMPYNRKREANIKDFIFLFAMLLILFFFRFFDPVNIVGKFIERII
ncbi:MAG: cobalt ECF transporter T component CbiQ [Proteobacteria bacterium]|nr:cobalt ECF transporter T component CbiQ [Pseudomonadota bacterium]